MRCQTALTAKGSWTGIGVGQNNLSHHAYGAYQRMKRSYKKSLRVDAVRRRGEPSGPRRVFVAEDHPASLRFLREEYPPAKVFPRYLTCLQVQHLRCYWRKMIFMHGESRRRRLRVKIILLPVAHPALKPIEHKRAHV